MLHMLLLAALGADPGAWGEAQVGGAGSYGSGPSIQTYSGLGSASISAFLHHRLRDDDAPLSLQPYLQRAGAIGGSFSVSGSSTESPNYLQPYKGTTIGGEFSLDAYPGEMFTLWASASFFRSQTSGGYPQSPSIELLLPRAEIGPGVRIDATRVTVGYTYAPTIINGTYDGRGLGQLYLRITTVIVRRFYLSALGELILSGGRARLDLEVFPWRALGLGATVEYAEGAIYSDSHEVYRQWQPSASVSWWLSRWFGLGLEYRFTHVEAVHQPGVPLDIHRGALTLAFRLG